MIRALVDFALKNRWLVLAIGVLLFAWGIISFHRLPVEAYPDVANNYVEVIAQWPGRQRRANRAPGHHSDRNPDGRHSRTSPICAPPRFRPLDRGCSSSATTPPSSKTASACSSGSARSACPPDLMPQMGTDWSPVGQIYWYTLREHQPRVRRDESEVARRLGGGKASQDRPRRRRYHPASAGRPSEYQVRLDPDKLVDYGLSIAQVEQQLANNNTNGGGSFIEEGAQQINVQSRRPVNDVQDIENTVVNHKTAHADHASRTLPPSRRGRRSAWARSADATHLPDGRIVDNPDTVEGIVLLQKGDDSDPRSARHSRGSARS